MKIATLTLGAYQTNCYLVWEDRCRTCAVIDPGYAPDTVLAEAVALGLTVDAVLLTHGHFDHVGAVAAIVRATGCKLWMHKGDCSTPRSSLFPLAAGDFTEICFFENMDTVSAGGLTFTVYETPGHTSGSVCLVCGNVMFTGDTLFAGSCGRTDFPGSDPQAMEDSLRFLRKLQFEGRIYPGHGPASSLEEERRTNPYLRGKI